MDKNIIKKHLAGKFLQEDKTPGIAMANKMKGEEAKINKSGVAAIDKDMSTYDKDLKQEDKGKNTMAVNKFNYANDAEKTYHDEMETLNGLEMTRYTSDTGEGFRDRAKKSMEGDAMMGNAIGGNAESAWGASDDNFGKKLAKRVENSQKKRDDAFIATYELGDKIMALPDDHKVQKSAVVSATGKGKIKGDDTKAGKSSSPKLKSKGGKINEGILADKNYTHFAINKNTNKILEAWNFKGVDPEDLKQDKNHYFINDLKDLDLPLKLSEIKVISKNFLVKNNINPQDINSWDNLVRGGSQPATTPAPIAENKKTNKNTMKRLTFKKEFGGVGNALKLIPESYKTDKKEFEMTDGNESYRIRWEGSLTEGRAVITKAVNKKFINEDIDRMKALFNYKSEETLGLVKGNGRLNENDGFTDVWNKTKKLLSESEEIEETTDEEETIEESENIEGQKASKTAPFEEAGTPAAPEVPAVHKKKLQTKDGTAPAAGVKDADNAVSVAPEVPAVHKKKLQTKDGTAPAPKTGPWEEASVNEGENIEGQKASKTAPFEEAGTPVAPEVPAVHKKKLQEKDGTAPAAGVKDADKAVSVAPEVPSEHKKKLQTKDGTAPAPKTGEWEEASVPQAAEAKKHVHMHESDEEEETIEEDADNFYEDKDEKEEITEAKLFKVKLTETYVIKAAGKTVKVPANLVELAKQDPNKAFAKI